MIFIQQYLNTMLHQRNPVLLVAAGCLAICLLAHLVTCCNEQVCASMVSKCMLTASCKCDLKDCSCCKECYNCLSYLYSECCSCVGNDMAFSIFKYILKYIYSF